MHKLASVERHDFLEDSKRARAAPEVQVCEVCTPRTRAHHMHLLAHALSVAHEVKVQQRSTLLGDVAERLQASPSAVNVPETQPGQRRATVEAPGQPFCALVSKLVVTEVQRVQGLAACECRRHARHARCLDLVAPDVQLMQGALAQFFAQNLGIGTVQLRAVIRPLNQPGSVRQNSVCVRASKTARGAYMVVVELEARQRGLENTRQPVAALSTEAARRQVERVERRTLTEHRRQLLHACVAKPGPGDIQVLELGAGLDNRRKTPRARFSYVGKGQAQNRELRTLDKRFAQPRANLQRLIPGTVLDLCDPAEPAEALQA